MLRLDSRLSDRLMQTACVNMCGCLSLYIVHSLDGVRVCWGGPHMASSTLKVKVA